MSEWFQLEGSTQRLLLFFLCLYKMYLISAKRYKNAIVDFLTIKTTSKIWLSMKDVGSGIKLRHIWFSFKRNIWYLWNKKSLKKTS